MAITIRPAITTDRDVIAHFNCAIAQETEDRALDIETVITGVAQLLASDSDGFYLVAEAIDMSGKQIDHEQSVVGCLLVTYEWSDWRNGMQWWIQSVYVHPDWRRQGIFRQLFKHVQQMASEDAGVCGLRLYVEKDNAIAQNTYASMGMKETPYKIFELELSDSASTLE